MKKFIAFLLFAIGMMAATQLYGQSVTITTVPTPPTICSGDVISLTANGTPPPVIGYLWSTGANTQAINVTPATTTTYTVTVTLLGGSTASNAVTVTVLTTPTATISAAGPTTFCAGGNVNLNSSTTGGVTTYEWRLNGNPIPGATNPSYVATASGTYSLYVSNGSCGATSSNTIIVTVNPLPPATVTPGGPLTICYGTSITLTANAGYTYQWQSSPTGLPGTWTDIGGQTSQTLVVNATGHYRVRTTDGNGCQNFSN